MSTSPVLAGSTPGIFCVRRGRRLRFDSVPVEAARDSPIERSNTETTGIRGVAHPSCPEAFSVDMIFDCDVLRENVEGYASNGNSMHSLWRPRLLFGISPCGIFGPKNQLPHVDGKSSLGPTTRAGIWAYRTLGPACQRGSRVQMHKMLSLDQ